MEHVLYVQRLEKRDGNGIPFIQTDFASLPYDSPKQKKELGNLMLDVSAVGGEAFLVRTNVPENLFELPFGYPFDIEIK